MSSLPRSSWRALALSALGLALVAVVAGARGSPLQPKLPPGAAAGGPFAAMARALGLDGLSAGALAMVSVIAVVSSAVAFLYVANEARRGRVSLRAVIVLSVVAHAAVLTLPLLVSRDVYSYIANGQIAGIHHANPYVLTPADFPHDPVAALVGPKWFSTPAVYGPLFTSFAGVLVRLFDSLSSLVAAFRVTAAAASIGTLAVIVWLAHRLAPERAAFAAAAFGLNPVVLFQSVGSGHNDQLVALAVAGALALVVARREGWAVAALALGALVKVTAALPLVVLLVWIVARRPAGERLRAALLHTGIAAAIGLTFAAPYLQLQDPTLGMTELAGHEGWLAPSRLFRRMLDAMSGDTLGFVARIVFAIVLVLVVASLARRVARDAGSVTDLGAALAWSLLALMLLGPVLLPWYVVWALPLVWLLPRTPRLVMLTTSTALAVSQFAAEPDRFKTAYETNLFVGHYVITPVVVIALGVLLLDLWRRLRRDAPLADALAEDGEVPAAARER